MDIIPKDHFIHINAYLTAEALAALSTTSKLFLNIVEDIGKTNAFWKEKVELIIGQTIVLDRGDWDKIFHILSGGKFDKPIHSDCSPKCMSIRAAQTGILWIFKIYETSGDQSNELEKASEYGHLDVVKHIIESNKPINVKNSVMSAMVFGHVIVLNRLSKTGKIRAAYIINGIDLAAKSQRYKILSYILNYNNRRVVLKTTKAAASRGMTNVLKQGLDILDPSDAEKIDIIYAAVNANNAFNLSKLLEIYGYVPGLLIGVKGVPTKAYEFLINFAPEEDVLTLCHEYQDEQAGLLILKRAELSIKSQTALMERAVYKNYGILITTALNTRKVHIDVVVHILTSTSNQSSAIIDYFLSDTRLTPEDAENILLNINISIHAYTTLLSSDLVSNKMIEKLLITAVSKGYSIRRKTKILDAIANAEKHDVFNTETYHRFFISLAYL